MISKIKALGLAFVAITAMSAIAASAAQAGQLDVGIQPAVITGHSEPGQEHVLTVTKSTPENKGEKFNSFCPTASLEATTQGLKIDELTATATYGPNAAGAKCQLFGQPATVQMHGCKYTLTGTQTTAGVLHPANTATVDIVGCTAGKQITIQSAFCQVVIPEQNHLSHVVGKNELTEGVKSVTLEATVAGITHTQFGACPDGNNHHSNNASFAGNTWVKAYKDEGVKQVTEHGHQFSKVIDTHPGGLSTLEST
jgi:hypothetical protein